MRSRSPAYRRGGPSGAAAPCRTTGRSAPRSCPPPVTRTHRISRTPGRDTRSHPRDHPDRVWCDRPRQATSGATRTAARQRRQSSAARRRQRVVDTSEHARPSIHLAGAARPSSGYHQPVIGRPRSDRRHRSARSRSAGTRSRSSSASATRRRPARRSSGSASDTWRASLDFLYDEAMRPRDGRADRLRRAAPDLLRRGRRPGDRRPSDPTTLGAVLDEFTARIAPHSSTPTTRGRFATSRRRRSSLSIVGELLAQVDQPGRRRLARGPRRRVRRGGGRPLAVRPRRVRRGQLRAAHVGRRDGQLHRDGPRPATSTCGRCTGASRPPRGAALEGVRVYTSDQTHFSIARALDELGFPPETLVVAPVRRPVPPPRGARRRGDRPRPGGRPDARSRSAAVAGSTNTGSVDRDRGAGGRSPRREGLWFHVDAAYGGGGPPLRRATPAGSRTSTSPTRSRSTRTSGSSRPTTSAALLVRDGSHLRQTFGGRARVLPRRRGRRGRPGRSRRRARRRPPGRARRPAQLLQARLRGHASLARAQAVDDVEAPRHERASAGSSRRTTTSPRYLAAPLRRGGRLRGAPRRAGAVGRLLPPPPGRRGGRRDDGPARARRPPGPARRRRSRRPATAGSRRRASAARRGCAPGIVNYLTTEADIDRLLATLRRLAGG